jgi:hypothetical protein
MYSVLSLLPDKRSGFVMLTNGEGSDARTVLTEVLLKHFTAPARSPSATGRSPSATGRSPSATGRSPSAPETMDGREGPPETMDGRVGPPEATAGRERPPGEARRVAEYADTIAHEPVAPAHKAPDTSSRTPLTAAQAQRLLGVWRDPWFGAVSLCLRGAAVRFTSAKSPLLTGTLMRVGRRNLVDWDDKRVDAEVWLDIADGGAKQPATLTMSKVDPSADFSFDFEDLSFKRERDCD